jgi:hypothetical protein
MKRAVMRFRTPRDAQVVSVLRDASIGTVGISDGRLVAVVVVDTTSRPDIEDLVRMHEHLRMGDSTSVLGFPTRWKHKTVCLGINFTQPYSCGIYLEFDILSQGVVVDQIVRNEMLYIQPGRPGDGVIHDYEAPKILVELPFRNFAAVWDLAWRDALQRDFRKKGLSRRKAGETARDITAELREIYSKRVGAP